MMLDQAIHTWARRTWAVQDRDLERAWVWGDYDEGVRFAFFRTYEQLRDLAAGILALRRDSGMPMTLAQHLLGQYHAAYLDMQAVLLGIDDTVGARIPAEGEWPLQRVLAHITQAERSFYAITAYAVDRLRSRDDRPLEMSEAAWDLFWRGDRFEELKAAGSLSQIAAYYADLHRRVLNTFIDLEEDELAAPSVFWESTPMSVRFRLHRFESHLRQHTIQMEKARTQLALGDAEALRLCRLLYAGLAEVEGASLGSGGIGWEDGAELAHEINSRRIEIEAVLASEYQPRPPD